MKVVVLCGGLGTRLAYPVSRAHVFWIGLYPGITQSMIDYMVETFHQISRTASAAHGA